MGKNILTQKLPLRLTQRYQHSERLNASRESKMGALKAEVYQLRLIIEELKFSKVYELEQEIKKLQVKLTLIEKENELLKYQLESVQKSAVPSRKLGLIG